MKLGQLLVGGPETVLTQIRAIRAQLDAGILDLNVLPVSRDKILRSIELFGTKVLPRTSCSMTPGVSRPTPVMPIRPLIVRCPKGPR